MGKISDFNLERSDYFYQLGRKDERDRAIEILEEAIARLNDSNLSPMGNYLQDIVKTIKGEQK